MKVCVIGGAGYIGSHTIYELIKNGDEVVVIDDLSTGDETMIHPKAKFYEADITNKKVINKIFGQECQHKPFDVVMHFAAKLIIPESIENPLKYYYNNVEGVRIMLEVMVENSIKNIVFSSTAAVYGNPINEVCTEEDQTIPINPYGETKLSSEKMIQWISQRYNINYCIFRYFNVAGADESLKIGLNKDYLTHLIPVCIETALGIRDKVVIYGNDYDTKDGTCIRDYIHVSDLARAHVLGAEYILKNNEKLILNLGSNEGYTVLEVIKEIEKYLPVNYEIGSRRVGDSAKIIASNYKAKNILKWEPLKSLADIIHSDLEYRKILSNKKTDV